MQVYLLNYFSIIIYLFIYCIIPKQKRTRKVLLLFFSILFLQFVVIQGFRGYGVGLDTKEYIEFYQIQNYSDVRMFFSHRFELLFKILTYAIHLLKVSSSIYLFIISILSNIAVFYAIYKYSKNPFISLLVYVSFGFYFTNFCLLRQSIAYGIVFISAFFIRDRKFAKFLICLIVAFLFHQSAIFFAPAYFIYNFEFTFKNTVKIVLIDVLIFILRVPVFTFITAHFYERYALIISNSYNWMILCFTVLLILFTRYKEVTKNNSMARMYYIFSFVGASLMLFASVGNNVMRIANYYYMFIILLIPEYIYSFSENKNKIFASLVCIITSTILFSYVMYVDNAGVVPYVFLK